MQLDKIITLANAPVEIPFRAMERSLRATGCQLPLLVIPYDDNLFPLPPGSEWWRVERVIRWTETNRMHRMMRKYQCLTIANYQYVDTDVVFVRDPSSAILNLEGFVASCGHWSNVGHAVTEGLVRRFRQRSTNWPSAVFNAGQFACNRALYTIDTLIETANRPENSSEVVSFPWHDQPGLNLLVYLSEVQITNLTLPPHRMESTWAGDYDGDYRRYWPSEARTPYLIHWAGRKPKGDRPIDELFFRHLTTEEAITWKKKLAITPRRKLGSLRGIMRRVKRAAGVLLHGG